MSARSAGTISEPVAERNRSTVGNAVDPAVELTEPFARIRDAVAEARKMVPSLTHDRKYAAPALHKAAVAKAAE